MKEGTKELASTNSDLKQETEDRKKAEDALRFAQFAIDKSSDEIFRISSDARFDYVNEAACQTLGYSQDELLKMTVYDIDPHLSKEVWAEHWKEIKERGSFSVETVHQSKEGKIIPMEIRSNHLEYNGKEYNFVFARNITERKEAEKELRRAADIVNNIQVGLYIYHLEDINDDRTLRMIAANEAAADFTGVPVENVVGKTLDDNFPGLREKGIPQIYAEVVRSGCPKASEDVYYGDQRVIDGAFAVKAFPLPDNCVGVSFENITEQKKAEEEKRGLEAKLQRSEKMEAIGTLAAGVAHDLNNILGGIVGYPDLIMLGLPEDSPLRKPILTMQESGKRAASIIQDLLTLARRGVSISQVVDLNETIMEYLRSPECEKLKACHPNVQIKAHLEPNLFNILGSPVHLSKTIMNLISNAAEAVPDEGKVTVSSDNRYFDGPIDGFDTLNEGEYVVLSVSDNGIGISPEDQERIFEPFYTRKVMGRSGTGLGMSVVWGTVKDHDGYINVESAAGKGTMFELYFPITAKSGWISVMLPPLRPC